MPRSVQPADQQPISIHVLGPIAAFAQGEPIALKGPIHKALLARLIIARGEVVSVDRLAEDLWASPPPRAVGSIRTFVGDLRHALEPDRPPRGGARLLVTEGNGYALRHVDTDARRFEQAVEHATVRTLTDALALWRGTA
jgi:DNA-binding SARP family transcriptional activator